MNNRTKDNILAWILLSPAVIVLTAFGLFPILYALFVSLHSWRIKQDAFVGLKHYIQALGDPVSLLVFFTAFSVIFLISRVRKKVKQQKKKDED